MFSVIRSKGGHCSNPTTVQARAALRSITCNDLIKPSSRKNCESTDFQFLLPRLPESSADSQKTGELSTFQTSDIERETEVMESISLNDFRAPELKSEASIYVAGYFIHRFVLCPTCKSILTESNITSCFVKEKCFKSNELLQPKQYVIDDFNKMNWLSHIFLSQVSHLPDISSLMIAHPEIEPLFNFNLHSSTCKANTQRILLNACSKFFIKLFCKRTTESFKASKTQTLNKFKKLLS